MDLTAYGAIDANRRRSRVVAGLNAAILAFLFGLAVWVFGPEAVRPASSLVIVIGSAMFGGRDVVLLLLGARPLSAAEDRRLARRFGVISAGLGLRVPPTVRLVVSPYPNALAIERVGQAGTLVLTDRLLELDDDELDAVLAHELFHLASAFVGLRSVMALFRGLVMSVLATRALWHRLAWAAVLVIAVVTLGPAPLIFLLFVAVYLIAEARISREREYLADAQAVLVTRHPEGLIRALRRMSSAEPLAAVVPRAKAITEDGERLAASLWTVRPTALAGGWVSRLLDAHPSTEDRTRRLARMS
jgi:heat shock protein HtpX